MIASDNVPKELKDPLIKGLAQLPLEWALTPLLGNKAPYQYNWQHENPISLADIQRAIQQGELVTYSKKNWLQNINYPQSHQKAIEAYLATSLSSPEKSKRRRGCSPIVKS